MLVALTDNCGYSLYGLAYGMLSILVVALFVPPLLREFGLYGLPISFLYAVYGPVADQGVAIKCSHAPNTSAHGSLIE